MSRDVITIGSTMRIPLLYRGEYSQWRERFMNYLEEQTDGEAMINSIQNGNQPLPVIAQVSLAGTAQNAPPTLKDPKFWTAEEKKTRKIDLINDLKKYGYKKDNCKLNYKFLNNLQPEWKQYGTLMRQTNNLMDINIDTLYNIIKQNQRDVNDALGYKKKAVLVTSNPLALVAEKTNVSKRKEKVVVSSDSEGSGTDDFSELKKIIALLVKAFNQRKFYSKPTNNNLRTSSTSQSANKKQEFVKSNDKKEDKKADEKKRDMSKVKCYNCKKEGHFVKDCKKAKDQAWMESSSDSDKEINANMVFMEQNEKVLSESEEGSSSAEETIAEVAYYTSESESESDFETLEYYNNSTNYGLFVNNDDDQEIFHDAIESASENFIENHIDSQKDYDKSKVDHNDSEEKEHLVDKLIRKFNHKIAKCQKHVEKANQQSNDFENQNKDLKEKYDVLINQIADQEVLFDKMSVQFVELDKHVRDLKNTVLEKDFKISELEECVRNKDLEIDKCLERLNVCENKLHKMGQTNQTVHMIMPSKDNLYNGRKGIGFENPRYFEKAKDLRPSLYDEKVIGLGSLKPYVLNVILEKIIIDLEDEVVSILEKEKENLKTIESLKSNSFESSENAISESKNQSENDCHVIEKECDKVENPKVIAPRMFKLNVSQSVSPISMSKMSCESNNVESKLKRKRRKRKSSKQNVKQVDNDVSRANNDFVHFSNLDTFSSVRRPKHSGVI
nr:nucleolar protein 58-like [Tanacetum cinerariifolium]